MEYSGNPVLDPDIRAYYPCVIYDVNGFHGHGVSAKMWFNSYYSNRYSIWFAFSNDGTTWNLHNSSVSGLSNNSGHPWVLYFPEGFLEAIVEITLMVQLCTIEYGTGMPINYIQLKP